MFTILDSIIDIRQVYFSYKLFRHECKHTVTINYVLSFPCGLIKRVFIFFKFGVILNSILIGIFYGCFPNLYPKLKVSVNFSCVHLFQL